MSFTLPNDGSGDHTTQSIVFQQDLDVLVDGFAGIDCVLSGLAVTGGADMTPAVAKGSVLSNRVMFAVAAADVTIGTAHATNPRIDLIVVNSSGALAVRAGTAAANPQPPDRTANDVVIAHVYVAANDTSIETTKCIDKRVVPQFPIVIYRTTTAETTNTTAAAIDILNKAGSGVSIPNGLFLTGRELRIWIGGNMRLFNGTPTVTLTFIYGATTMYTRASVAAVADTDRGAWVFDARLIAQANNDQSMVGSWQTTPIDGARANSTGIGDFAFANTSNRLGAIPVSGAAAIDSDAANSTLRVQITISTSHVDNEIVVEGATVELM